MPLRSSVAWGARGERPAVTRVLYGMRNYEAAAEAIPGANDFIQASAACPGAGPLRRGLVLFAEATSGAGWGKTLPGLRRDGYRERESVDPVLASFQRGLDVSQGVLVLLDGGKGLRSAVRKAFRDRALVQRCQWHKRENVVSYLAKTEQPSWRQRLQRAYNRPEYDEARAALETLHRELANRRPQLGGRLRRDLDTASTRALRRSGPLADEPGGQCARRGRCAKVDHWQNSRQRHRWLATALLDIEPRLRKVMGYRHLPKLRAALTRELKIDTTTSKKEAA